MTSDVPPLPSSGTPPPPTSSIAPLSSPKGARWGYLDALKALAILLVVAVHVSDGAVAPALARARASGGEAAWASMPPLAFRTVVGLAAVNLFFMASGAMLLERKHPSTPEPLTRKSVWAGYRRRFGKLLPPFLIWSLFFLGFRWVKGWDWPPPMRERLLLPPGTFYHLWFMYMLFGLYVVTPGLRALRARWEARRLWQWGAVAVLLGVGAVETAMDALVSSLAAEMDVRMLKALQFPMRFAGHAGIFWAGALWHERPATGGRARMAVWAAVVGGALGAVWAVGMWLDVWSGMPKARPVDAVPMMFTSPVGVFGMLTASGLFCLFRGMEPGMSRWRGGGSWGARGTGWLSRESFGIYLIHVLGVWCWIDFLGGDGIQKAGTMASVGMMVVVTVGIAYVSGGVTSLLRRVPGLKWLLP